MIYRIYKNGQAIATYTRVTLDGTSLVCRKEFGSRVDLILAAGQWDSVVWEEN